MNIIIVGCGKVGQKLAERLSIETDLNITVIDSKPGVIHNIINEYDVMGIVGSAVNAEILTEAGIEHTDIIIAVTGSDELNLLT